MVLLWTLISELQNVFSKFLIQKKKIQTYFFRMYSSKRKVFFQKWFRLHRQLQRPLTSRLVTITNLNFRRPTRKKFLTAQNWPPRLVWRTTRSRKRWTTSWTRASQPRKISPKMKQPQRLQVSKQILWKSCLDRQKFVCPKYLTQMCNKCFIVFRLSSKFL